MIFKNEKIPNFAKFIFSWGLYLWANIEKNWTFAPMLCYAMLQSGCFTIIKSSKIEKWKINFGQGRSQESAFSKIRHPPNFSRTPLRVTRVAYFCSWWKTDATLAHAFVLNDLIGKIMSPQKSKKWWKSFSFKICEFFDKILIIFYICIFLKNHYLVTKWRNRLCLAVNSLFRHTLESLMLSKLTKLWDI